MRIVDRKTLATMPNGTLYCGYTPDMLTGDWNIITGHHGLKGDYGSNWKNEGFISTLPLEPFIQEGEYKAGTQRITNWCTVDTCDYDYDENELFAVFSKTEIRAMITVLQYALSDCNFPISKFMDTYYLGDNEIDEKKLDDWED